MAQHLFSIPPGGVGWVGLGGLWAVGAEGWGRTERAQTQSRKLKTKGLVFFCTPLSFRQTEPAALLPSGKILTREVGGEDCTLGLKSAEVWSGP